MFELPCFLPGRDGGRQWQEQRHGGIWQPHKPVVPVKSHCRFILRIHYHGVCGDLGMDRTVEGIGQERSTETTTLEFLIDSQTAHAYCGHGWVSWELPANVSGEIAQQYACRRQGVIARDALFVSQCHKAGGYAAANVLADLLSQVPIQG